jgi:hypothetical protein
LPLTIPVPVECGVPGDYCPWHWSILPWITGQTADVVSPSSREAAFWVSFLRALHVEAPTYAPRNEVRGVPLASCARAVEDRLGDWGDLTSGDSVTDPASLWMLFDTPSTREECLRAYDADEAMCQRATRWAIMVGSVLLDSGRVDHPAHPDLRRLILARVARARSGGAT